MSSIANPQRRSLGTLIGGAAYGRAFRRIEPAIDADAAKYLAAVEAADKQVLEDGVKRAVSAFVRACKADGNWDAIKASCILCGARTLAGALVPLKGLAPTNYNFVGLGTDYTRADGLQGNGSTKYLDSNAAATVAPLNNAHAAVFVSSVQSAGARCYIGVFSGNGTFLTQDTASPPSTWVVSDSGSGVPRFTDSGTGFKAVSRSTASNFIRRTNGSSTTVTRTASTTPSGAETFGIFARGSELVSDGRIAFYSIGEAVDLALLDTAVSTLVSEIGAAV